MATINALCTYDFTLKAENRLDEVKEWLRQWCKKWCFQKEKGNESGYEHFQGRFSTKIKYRQQNLPALKGAHWSPTSSANQGNQFYVLKEETRIEGPWKDDDMEMSFELKQVKNLRPWQNSIVSLAKIYDPRKIDIVVEIRGNVGKSTLIDHMEYNCKAKLLPMCLTYKDMMQFVCSVGEAPIYLIDLPRAIPKKHMPEFFGGIETLKDGRAFDTRYSGKMLRMKKRPNIWIFTNIKPDISYLSMDKWRFWTIEGQMLLETSI